MTSAKASAKIVSSAPTFLPVPRAGVLGVLDRFIGPGTTSAEIVLQSDTPGKAGGLMNVTASKADAPPKVSDCESFSDCAA